MSGGHVAKRAQHGVLDLGVLDLEFGDEALHALPLEAEVAARGAAAADDRQGRGFRVRARLGLEDVDQGTDDDMLGIVRHEPRRHGLQRTLEEEIQQERLDEVVSMMPQRNFRRTHLCCPPIQHTAAEPGTERARRCPLVEDVVDRLADRRVLDMALPSPLRTRGGDFLVLVPVVPRVDVHGDQRELDRRATPEHVQNLDQRPAVFAAGKANHHAIAVLDEAVIRDGSRHFLRDASLELGCVWHILTGIYLTGIYLARIYPARIYLARIYLTPVASAFRRKTKWSAVLPVEAGSHKIPIPVIVRRVVSPSPATSASPPCRMQPTRTVLTVTDHPPVCGAPLPVTPA